MTAQRVEIIMQRLNANDDSGIVVRWFKTAGERVTSGDLVAQIETTKVNLDVEANADGFLFPLVEVGSKALVGEPIAWIVSSYDDDALKREKASTEANSEPSERLVSQKALKLMAEAGLKVTDIPGTGPITAHDVQQILTAKTGGHASSSALANGLPVNERSVLLFGAAAQGIVVLDALVSEQIFSPLCFIDEKPSMPASGGIPIFDTTVIKVLKDKGLRHAHVCIGSPSAKLRIAQWLKSEGFEIIRAIHARAVVSPLASLGEGVYIGPGAVIGPYAVVGDYSQVNNNATVPHHAQLGVAVRISDGANLAGEVRVGDRSLLGLGVTVNTGCHVGTDVTIMSGVSVFDQVPDGTIVRVTMGRRQ